MKKLFLQKQIWMPSFVAVVVILAAWLIFLTKLQHDAYLRARQLADVTAMLVQAKEKAYARQMAADYGGKTPSETIYLYIETVERGDYRLASTYFVKAKREAELSRFDNASVQGIRQFVTDLKAAMDVAAKATAGKTFTLEKPVAMRLEKVPNGAWQFISLKYKL